MIRYNRIVGMLIYISGYIIPDVAHAVNICDQYMFSPKLSHELTLKILVCYFNQKRYCGFILDPNYDGCKVDAYRDAQISGMYGHEKPADPACVKSCTGFIITFINCPFLWVSKLHTKSALLTMGE